MPAWPHTFGAESGTIAASQLDDNFAAAAFASDLTATNATVAALPSSTTPLVPVAGGAAGSAGTLSKSDHQHPPQDATTNVVSATSYTLQASDNGKIVEFTAATAVAVTLPNSLPAFFNCGFTQMGAGQVTFNAGAGSTYRQASSLTKTRAQYSEVSCRVSSNAGAAAIYVFSGDMA